jgi:transposase-like protein
MMALAGDVEAVTIGEASALLSAPPVRGDDYRRRGRRSWTIDEKLAIVAEAEASDETVAAVARRHGMNANHLFNWIQRARDGTLDRRRLGGASDGPMRFIDLGVTDRNARAADHRPAEVIEIELANGVRVRAAATIDAEALRQVLAAVKAAL